MLPRTHVYSSLDSIMKFEKFIKIYGLVIKKTKKLIVTRITIFFFDIFSSFLKYMKKKIKNKLGINNILEPIASPRKIETSIKKYFFFSFKRYFNPKKIDKLNHNNAYQLGLIICEYIIEDGENKYIIVKINE